jgi:hypothetical protein
MLQQYTRWPRRGVGPRLQAQTETSHSQRQPVIIAPRISAGGAASDRNAYIGGRMNQ